MESVNQERVTKRHRTDDHGGDDGSGAADASSASSSTSSEDPPASAEEFIPAARKGDERTVASALRNPLVDPNMVNQKGSTALIRAAGKGHAPVVTLLLADERVDPNICLLYTSPSPRDATLSRMPSSA